jgi:hypothetical protein
LDPDPNSKRSLHPDPDLDPGSSERWFKHFKTLNQDICWLRIPYYGKEEQKERKTEGEKCEQVNLLLIIYYDWFFLLDIRWLTWCSAENINCRDSAGRNSTPLHLAAGYNNLEVSE